MAKDPICGMDIQEEGALHVLHFEHETIFFCSKTCQETYTQQPGNTKSSAKKGLFGRFLEKLAKQNQQSYGNTPPKCH
jgi:YHS domain-containing protein